MDRYPLYPAALVDRGLESRLDGDIEGRPMKVWVDCTAAAHPWCCGR